MRIGLFLCLIGLFVHCAAQNNGVLVHKLKLVHCIKDGNPKFKVTFQQSIFLEPKLSHLGCLGPSLEKDTVPIDHILKKEYGGGVYVYLHDELFVNVISFFPKGTETSCPLGDHLEEHYKKNISYSFVTNSEPKYCKFISGKEIMMVYYDGYYIHLFMTGKIYKKYKSLTILLEKNPYQTN